MLTVREIAIELGAEVLAGADLLEAEVATACGADLMSDVLAFVKDRSVLLTGLVNQHVMRTAEVLDVLAVVFVRGKRPPDDVLEMARDRGIAILLTQHTLFTACGLLYNQGLRGGTRA